MTVETHVRQALDRVRDEQAVVDRKRTAYGRFVGDVAEMATETPIDPRRTLQTTGGSVVAAQSSRAGGMDGCDRVRERFAATVQPHTTADVDNTGSLTEAMAAELSEPVAMALAPWNATVGFTDGIKQGVLSAAAQRRSELRAMERALDREDASLVEASETLDDVLAWIVETNETPLTGLGFEALRARHDRLEGVRDRCETLGRDRQSVLHATTTGDGEAGLAHHELVACLYAVFPVAYPVLATVVRVSEVCDRCQKAVRAHLVRRV